ncbi:hypothetical protein HZS_2206 [Henneguya salminicola]|nr:hypothetical protein HZS_2206 [Henneguya salminicola]
MKKDGIPDGKAQFALNIMRSLSSIDGHQINENLQEIQTLKGLTHQNWPQFWEYFRQIWIEKYPPSLWKNKRKTENLNSRTNNCPERYNRRLGSKFQNAHPNIFGLIAAIKDDELYFSNLTPRIRSGNIPHSVEFEY